LMLAAAGRAVGMDDDDDHDDDESPRDDGAAGSTAAAVVPVVPTPASVRHKGDDDHLDSSL
jgi:hypothetical protein